MSTLTPHVSQNNDVDIQVAQHSSFIAIDLPYTYAPKHGLVHVLVHHIILLGYSIPST